MHEISIAESLMKLIRRHMPARQRLVRADVHIGPMHGVVSEAMQLAWKITACEAGWPVARLVIHTPPWRLRCTACGRCWEPDMVDEHCVCGCACSEIMGGDEFQLDSIEIEPALKPKGRKLRARSRHHMKTFRAGERHEHQSSNC